MLLFRIGLLCFFCQIFVNDCAKYDYLKPNEWSAKFGKSNGGFCDGLKQSPINVDSQSLLKCTNSPINLTISHHSNWIVKNNGHGYESYPSGLVSGKESIMRLVNNWSPNKERNQEYCFDQLHFHWGLSNEFPGSEHSIDNQFSQLEVHFVHHSCDYPSLGHALTIAEKKKDIKDKYVLAVIGVMFEIGPENIGINQLFNNGNPELLKQIRFPSGIIDGISGQSILTSFNISHLLPNNLDYYYYEGGLTTPDCGEFVRWHLMKNKLTVSQKQMDFFRNLFSNKISSLSNNVRPPQINTFKPHLCTYMNHTKSTRITFRNSPMVKNNISNYENINVDGIIDIIHNEPDNKTTTKFENVTNDNNNSNDQKAQSLFAGLPLQIFIPLIATIAVLFIIVVVVVIWNLKLRNAACLSAGLKKTPPHANTNTGVHQKQSNKKHDDIFESDKLNANHQYKAVSHQQKNRYDFNNHHHIDADL